MAGHIVTGPLAIAKDAAGKLRYLYKDSPVPDDIPADEVARLVETGLVAKVDEPEPESDGGKKAPAKTSPKG